MAFNYGELFRLQNGEIRYGDSVDLMGRSKELGDYTTDNFLCRKVIGEFICDTFITDNTFGHDALFNGAACMSASEAANYSASKEIYGWHISDLKIYNKPIGLSKFKRPCKGNCQYCDYALWETTSFVSESKIIGCSQKVSAPQSWCYVEKLQNEYLV